MTNTQKLFELIPKLGAVEFTGLARLLGVKLLTDQVDEGGRPIHRDFMEVLEEMMSKYDAQNRERKREILRLVKKATSKSRGRAAHEDIPGLDLALSTEDNDHACDSEDT